MEILKGTFDARECLCSTDTYTSRRCPFGNAHDLLILMLHKKIDGNQPGSLNIAQSTFTPDMVNWALLMVGRHRHHGKAKGLITAIILHTIWFFGGFIKLQLNVPKREQESWILKRCIFDRFMLLNSQVLRKSNIPAVSSKGLGKQC